MPTPSASAAPLERYLVDRNDAVERRRYIAGLEAAFGVWGDERRFRWAFDRSCGAGPADLAVLIDAQGRWVAGSALVHRLVRAPTGEVERAGIISSSWTLPEGRGRGCLAHFVEWSRERLRASGGSIVLAFMTETNASRRRLAAAGADLIPTCYAKWDRPAHGEDAAPAACADPPERLAERALRPVPGAHRFDYPDAGAWVGQLLERPDPVDVMRVPGGAAVIERGYDTDRLLAAIADDPAAPLDPTAVIATLIAGAARRGRKLFAFAIDPAWVAAARRLGASIQAGRLTVLDDRRRGAPWSLASGDRM
jgi:hypothetical protein